jgi:hypothetical protein
MFEVLKSVFEQYLGLVNIPAMIGSIAFLGIAGRITYVSTKKVRNTLLKSKMKRAEAKIREYARTNNPNKLRENLIRQQKLRYKGAKKQVVIKTEFGLDARTYRADKLTKQEARLIKYDAKAKTLALKGKMHKAEKIRAKYPEFQSKVALQSYVEKINYKNVDYDLTTNMLAVNSPKMLSKYAFDIKNKDVNSMRDREKSAGIYPMALEVVDQENNLVFKLSDVSAKRFWTYSTEGMAYLQSVLKENEENNINKTYTIEFFDVLANPKKDSPITATVSNKRELLRFIDDYDNKFKENNPYYFDNESITELTQRVEKSGKEYEFERIGSKRQLNDIKYAKGISENLKSKELERMYKNFIAKSNLTSKDSYPSITTVKMDGKEIFSTSVESESMRDATERFVDAYIFVLEAFRIYKDINKTGEITKTVETISKTESSYNTVTYSEDKYKIFNEQKISLASLYKKNRLTPQFFPTVVAIAKEFKLGLNSRFLTGNNVVLTDEDARLIDFNLRSFGQKQVSFNYADFGLIDPDSPTADTYQEIKTPTPSAQNQYQQVDPNFDSAQKKKSTRQNNRPNILEPEDFEEVNSKRFEDVESFARNTAGSFIKTGNSELERDFYKEVKKIGELKNSPYYNAKLNYLGKQKGIKSIQIELALKTSDSVIFNDFLAALLNETYLIALDQASDLQVESQGLDKLKCHLSLVMITPDNVVTTRQYEKNMYSLEEIESDVRKLFSGVKNEKIKKDMSKTIIKGFDREQG